MVRLGCVKGLHSFNLISGGVLILMSFSGSFNLNSGRFLAAPPLSLHPLPSPTSNCSNLPFGTQGRSWSLESVPYKQEMGDRKASMPRSLTGSFSISHGEDSLGGRQMGLILVALGGYKWVLTRTNTYSGLGFAYPAVDADVQGTVEELEQRQCY